MPGYSDFRLIAEGGEGTVYRARQDGLDRYVAVKVINVGDPARLARFRRELEITVRLGRQHPHIVTVIDTGTAPGGRQCIVMEYYDLGSLHDRLRERGPLPVEEVVAAGVAVADALAFAHGQGFLHRDVKPQNILVLPTSYVLADFGIARLADSGNTSSMHLVSYRHAAPQMIDGADPSAADDLWSLGSTLFTLLDGAPPFSVSSEEDTVLAYLGRVRSGEPRPLRRADVPPELAAVIARCLSRPREDRFPDAASLRSALSAVDIGSFGWTPSMPVADFGPQPTPPAPPVVVEPQRDPDLTAAGPGSDLAGLTVRLPDDRTTQPDFGPWSAPPVLPAPTPVFVPGPTAPVDVPAPPPRKIRRILLFAVAAILVGAAIGVLATVLSRLNDRPTPEATPTSPPPSTPPQVTTTVPAGGDPTLAPALNRLEDSGSSVTLFWSDPTNGKAQFVIVDVTGTRPEPLVTVAAGATTYTVEGLDPAAEQYCYQVIAIGLDDPTRRAASTRTCAIR